MKIKINSTYDKVLKYAIYGINDQKRKLIQKGKFVRNIEADIDVCGNELIVRIIRRNLFIAFLSAIYVGIANFGNLLINKPRSIGSGITNYLSLYPFDELRIKDISRSENMEIIYHRSPMYRRVNNDKITAKGEYMICKTHPYAEEISGRTVINRILYAFVLVFWLVIVELVCNLIVYIMRR